MDETSRAGITPGLANAVQRGRLSEYACTGCGFGFPVYTGRYPSACPRCSGTVERRKTRQRPVAEAEKALDPTKTQIASLRQQQQIIGKRMVRARKQGNTPPRQMALMAKQKATIALRQATLVAQQPADETSRGSMEDHLPGRTAKRDPADFDPAALAAGIEVEMGHTDDPEVAQDIAMDHLREDPEYYVKLAKYVEPGETLGEGVADTILSQIKAGATDRSMLGSWGLRNLTARADGLSFDVNGRKFKGRVVVTLDRGHDLYNVELGRVRSYEWVVVKKVDGIDAENLGRVLDGMIETGAEESRARAVAQALDAWRAGKFEAVCCLGCVGGGPCSRAARDEGKGDVFCTSMVPRIKAIIDAGALSTLPHAGDPFCSRTRTIPVTEVEAHLPGGVAGLRAFFEERGGRYYRMEGPTDPVLVLEGDLDSMRLFATSAPSAYIGFDPRAEMVDLDVSESLGRADLVAYTRSILSGLEDGDEGTSPEAVVLARAFRAAVTRNEPAHGVAVVASRLAAALDVEDATGPAASDLRDLVAQLGYNPDHVIAESGAIIRGGPDSVVFGFSHDTAAAKLSQAVGFYSQMDIAAVEKINRGSALHPIPAQWPSRYGTFVCIRFTSARRKKELLGYFVNIAAQTHGVIVEAAAAPTGKSVLAPRPDTGDGAQRAHGGFRFTIGKNQKPEVRTDVARSLQNTRNSRRGVASRVKAAKEWHRSAEGQSFHRDLGRYNKGNHRGGQDETSVALSEDYGPNSSGYTHGMPGYNERTVDDVFQGILRKLVVIESLDILQDVEFTDEGGIYLMFDPSLPRREIEDIVQVLREGNDKLALAGAPDGSMGASADWWLVFLPGPTEGAGTPTPPQQNPLADPNATPGANEPPKQQMVIPAKTAIGNLAASLDIDAALKGM